MLNKKVKNSIEMLFSGLDDPILKQVMLTAYAGEDPKILEEMQKQEQKDMEQILAQMKIENATEVVGETKTILSGSALTDPPKILSDDIITTDGNN